MTAGLEKQHGPLATSLSEADLVSFMDTNVIGLHAVGPDGRLLWANQADHELLGYAREEYLGRHIAEFHADQALIADILARLLRGERLVGQPATLVHKDGSLRHVLIDSSGHFWQGRFLHTRCFTRDVTAMVEQSRLNEALVRAQGELGDALLVWDDDRVHWANDAFGRLVGYAPDEVRAPGFPVLARLLEQDRSAAKATEGGAPRRYEAVLERKDGTLVPCDVSVNTLSPGSHGKRLCIVRDISERRRVEREAKERDAYLTRATLALLEAPLDPDEVVRVVVRIATERLADAASVDLLGAGGDIRRVLIAHKDPGRQAFADELARRFPPSARERRVLERIPRGQVHVANDQDDADIAESVPDAEARRLLRAVGCRHTLLVPLWTRGGLVGSFSFLRADGPQFATEDVFLAKSLAARAALAYENALLHRAVKDAEERARAIFENAPVEILTVDRDGHIDAANRGVAGAPVSSLLGKRLEDALPWAQHARLAPLVRDALDRGVTADCEMTVDGEGGEVRLQMRVAPRRDGARVNGVIVISVDITERERALAALAQSEERFRTLVTATTRMVWSTDAAGLIVDMPEWRAFTGQTIDEVKGAGWVAAIHPEDRELVVRTWQQAYDSRGVYEAEYRVRSKTGEYRTFLARAVPRAAPDGRLLEYIGTWTDVTEERRAVREAEALRAQLVQGEKLAALGSLVSGVAHEIRTPLTYLANNLFLIDRNARRAALAPTPQDAAGAIAALEAQIMDAHESIDRINRIVGDLGRYTRLKSAAERERLSLDVAIRDAVELYRATHRGQSVLEVELRPTAAVRVDRVQIQQVVLNLLQNAGEARPREGRIRIRTYESAAGEPTLEVSDDGHGIPAAVLARMWDPFFTTKPEGSGLGLSIVKRIVDAHGAAIECRTRIDEGTTFRVTFPARPSP